MSRIAIIGAGAWGTALAIVLGRKGTHQVRLWANELDVSDSIARERINEQFPAGLHPARIDYGDQRSQHCARCGGDRRQCHAFAALSRALRTHGADAPPGNTSCQLH